MSAGSSGTIIARGSLRDRAQPAHGERRLEHRLLERARREAVSHLLDENLETAAATRREVGHGNPALRRARGGRPRRARPARERRRSATSHSSVRRPDELPMVENLDTGPVQPLEIEVAPVLVDSSRRPRPRRRRASRCCPRRRAPRRRRDRRDRHPSRRRRRGGPSGRPPASSVPRLDDLHSRQREVGHVRRRSRRSDDDGGARAAATVSGVDLRGQLDLRLQRR